MNQPADDTIEVRPDERLDPARVAEYLYGKLPGSEQPLAIRQFGGGAANLTYLLDYGAHQYVLRRPPLGPVAPSSHDMSREYRVLSVLHQAYPLAPRAWLFCDDPEVAGAPFFVMDRRRGVVVRQKLPEHYATFPDAPHQMSVALVDALADFHAVDYTALGLETLGKPDGFVQRQIEGWWRRWQKAKTEDLPVMGEVYRWLSENIPQTTGDSLVHNDYKLDNVMLSHDDPGQLVAVFDWDMCTLGDPLCDLGALLAYWTEPSDSDTFKGFVMMPTNDPRFMPRAELVQRYTERTGRDVTHINFYYALALYRLTVIIAQIYIRYVRGQTQDQRFATFGERMVLIAQAAWDVATGKQAI